MQKSKYYGLLFAAILALSLFLLSVLPQKWNFVKEVGITGTDRRIKAVFIGDSEVNFSFIPAQLWQEHGIPADNCGTFAQKMYQAEDALRIALKTQDVQVVLLEANGLFTKFNLRDDIFQTVQNWIPVMHNHDMWKPESLKRWPSPDPEPYARENKGYYTTFQCYPAFTLDYMEYSEELEPIPAPSLRHLETMHRLCRERGVTFLLVGTPSVKNWSYSRHNAVAKLAEEMDIPFVDMNLLREEIPVDWQTDTMDAGHHLNYSGAVKVTSYLGTYLANVIGMQDDREDPRYSDWNTSADWFYEMLPDARQAEVRAGLIPE